MPIELRDLEVDSVGLVPMGANKRKFIVVKDADGGEQYVDVQQVAEAIVQDPQFWERLVDTYSGEEMEKAEDKAVVRAKMAMRILGVENVEDAISALRAALGKADTPTEVAEEKAQHQDEEPEYEEPAKKADRKAEYEEPEEEYPKPGATKSEELPEGFSELVRSLMERVETSERTAQEAVQELERMRQEARRNELYKQAERYSALPEVQPEEFTDVLLRLEKADPEVFQAVTRVLDASSQAMRELYGELGSQTAPEEGNPFLAKVEARARELEREGNLSFAEAYAQAYVEMGEKYPNLAWAYLQRTGVS